MNSREELAEAIEHLQDFSKHQLERNPKMQDVIKTVIDALPGYKRNGAGEGNGCICQDQHRRGYCTEPGCPYALTSTERNILDEGILR